MLTDAVPIASVQQLCKPGCIPVITSFDRHTKSGMLARRGSVLGTRAGINPEFPGHVADVNALETRFSEATALTLREFR